MMQWSGPLVFYLHMWYIYTYHTTIEGTVYSIGQQKLFMSNTRSNLLFISNVAWASTKLLYIAFLSQLYIDLHKVLLYIHWQIMHDTKYYQYWVYIKCNTIFVVYMYIYKKHSILQCITIWIVLHRAFERNDVIKCYNDVSWKVVEGKHACSELLVLYTFCDEKSELLSNANLYSSIFAIS